MRFQGPQAGRQTRATDGISAVREPDNAEHLMWLNPGLLLAVSLATFVDARKL